MRMNILLILALLLLSATPTLANWWAEPVIFEATYYVDQNPGVRKQIGYDEAKLIQPWGKFGLKEGRKTRG